MTRAAAVLAIVVGLGACGGAQSATRVGRDAAPIGTVLGAGLSPSAPGRTSLHGRVTAIDHESSRTLARVEGEERAVTLVLRGELSAWPFVVGDELDWVIDCGEETPVAVASCSVVARDAHGLVLAVLRGEQDPVADDVSVRAGDPIGPLEGGCAPAEALATEVHVGDASWSIDAYGGWSAHDAGATRYWVQARAQRVVGASCVDQLPSSTVAVVLRAR